MKTNESSVTSLVSAFARAYHSQYDTPIIFDDYLADQLITPQEYTEISQRMTNGIHFFNEELAHELRGKPDEILKWVTQVILAPTPLARAAYCEQVLLNEIQLGVTQYVILGAGMDTFGLRHPDLHLSIFEVDHANTQSFKKMRLIETKIDLPDSLRYVSMDFTSRFNLNSLVKAGFSIHKKTFYSLLGVTFYLTKEQISQLLQQVFGRMPVGSSIVFDYADEKFFETKGRSNRVQHTIRMAEFGGESMKSSFSYEDLTTLLEEAGLLIYEHLSPEDIEEQFFKGRKDYLTAFESVHYIHAVKK